MKISYSCLIVVVVIGLGTVTAAPADVKAVAADAAKFTFMGHEYDAGLAREAAEMECADPRIAAWYCLNGGTCFELTNGTRGCHCTAKWTGERCIDRYIKPCEVWGSCTTGREAAVAAEPEVDEEGYIRGLTSEEIMNLPDMPDEEDEETAGMNIDQIIEKANQMGGGGEGSQPLADGTYLVGDIAMTKEQYEEHMAEWKIQEAELIARGEITPDK